MPRINYSDYVKSLKDTRLVLVKSGLTSEEANRFLNLIEKMSFSENAIKVAKTQECIDNNFYTTLILLKTKLP